MNGLALQRELKMTSVELVEKINELRKNEEENGGKKYVELSHSHLLRDIREELEALELANLEGQSQFGLTYYLDIQGKERPCYDLNRDGIMQMALSESAVVRFKVIEYVNSLENQFKETSNKANLLLAIYNGGQEGILASKQLTDIEVGLATKPLLETIESQQPKVEFADRLLKTKDNVLVREFAKVLCDEGITIGEKRLYKFLRENKLLMKNNEPYQSFIDRGIFQVKESTYDTPFGIKQSRTTVITPTGQLYLFKKLQIEFNIIE